MKHYYVDYDDMVTSIRTRRCPADCKGAYCHASFELAQNAAITFFNQRIRNFQAAKARMLAAKDLTQK
jgi:S-methylmethionine-dependent homocysteine/selenocysteine methylase